MFYDDVDVLKKRSYCLKHKGYRACKSREQKEWLRWVSSGMLLAVGIQARRTANKLYARMADVRGVVLADLERALRKHMPDDPALGQDILKEAEKQSSLSLPELLQRSLALGRAMNLPVASEIATFAERLTEEQTADMLMGAHFVVQDGGELYRRISSKEQAFRRPSSHYVDERSHSPPHVGYNEYLFGRRFHILVGETRAYGPASTWLQVEGAPFNTEEWVAHMLDNVEHASDALIYASTGLTENVGVLGTSKRTEFNPHMLLADDGSGNWTASTSMLHNIREV
jgi:hypothetical protein